MKANHLISEELTEEDMAMDQRKFLVKLQKNKSWDHFSLGGLALKV